MDSKEGSTDVCCLDMDLCEEGKCNTSDNSNGTNLYTETINLSDSYTFLEDIEPPSFLGSIYDSCRIHGSGYSSIDDEIQQEQLVSLNSTDDKFRSHFLNNSFHECEQIEKLPTEAEPSLNIVNKKSDTTKEISTEKDSPLSNKSNFNQDSQSVNKTLSGDHSSFDFEAETVKLIERLHQNGNLITGHESLMDLDKMSDSILIASSSADESVFLPNTNIIETNDVDGAKIGESFVVKSDDIAETVANKKIGESFVVKSDNVAETIVSTKIGESFVVKCNNVEEIVVNTKIGESFVVKSDTVAETVVNTKNGESFVVNADDVEETIVSAKNGESFVVKSNNVEEIVVSTKIGESFVVKSDNVAEIISTKSGESFVIKSDNVAETIVSTKNGESFVVKSDNVAETIVSTKSGESFVVKSDDIAETIVSTKSGDSFVAKSDNVAKSIVDAKIGESFVIKSDQDPENIVGVHTKMGESFVVKSNAAGFKKTTNTTFDIISDLVKENTLTESNVEELKNGKFLMEGKETNLMDMEASDLRYVLSHANTPKKILKRHSLQTKGTPSPSQAKRMSLNCRERMIKDGVKPNGNVLHKKLDINPFSNLNLFKGKLRAPSVHSNEKRKGPMKATYIPEYNRFDDSPTTFCKSRAASSPCTGIKIKKGSKSDSETSGPPMPSFGSVSTIDSDRPSTPDLGINETPEVLRKKNPSTMMTSTPSLKCEGAYVKMPTIKMADFPTPIMAPSSKTPLRNINETLVKSVCDEIEPKSERVCHVENLERIPDISESQNLADNNDTLKKNRAIIHTQVITNNEQKGPIVNAGSANRPVATDKENLNPSKVKQTSSSLSLKARNLNSRRISTVKPAIGARKPLTSKLTAIKNPVTTTGRCISKPVKTPCPRNLPVTKPLTKLSPMPAVSNVQTSCPRNLPVTKPPSKLSSMPAASNVQTSCPKNLPVTKPPTKLSSMPAASNVQTAQRRSISYRPVAGVKPKSTMPPSKSELPKPLTTNVNPSKNTLRSEGVKRCSVIPRPTFAAKPN